MQLTEQNDDWTELGGGRERVEGRREGRGGEGTD